MIPQYGLERFLNGGWWGFGPTFDDTMKAEQYARTNAKSGKWLSYGKARYRIIQLPDVHVLGSGLAGH